MGGVKVYFGGSCMAMIDRHRQDDPADGLFDFLGGASDLGDHDNPKCGICEDETVLDGCCTDLSITDGT